MHGRQYVCGFLTVAWLGAVGLLVYYHNQRRPRVDTLHSERVEVFDDHPDVIAHALDDAWARAREQSTIQTSRPAGTSTLGGGYPCAVFYSESKSSYYVYVADPGRTRYARVVVPDSDRAPYALASAQDACVKWLIETRNRRAGP